MAFHWLAVNLIQCITCRLLFALSVCVTSIAAYVRLFIKKHVSIQFTHNVDNDAASHTCCGDDYVSLQRDNKI